MGEHLPLYPYRLDPARLAEVQLLVVVKADRFASRQALRDYLLSARHDPGWQAVLDRSTASDLADWFILGEGG
jgi:hypothetical protein